MSPQPTTTPAATPEQSMTARQIARAKDLEKDRGELLEKIGKNRDFLRLMADNGEVEGDELSFVNDFYPEKEKGERRSEAEVTRTRVIRELARKHGHKAPNVPPPAAKED